MRQDNTGITSLEFNHRLYNDDKDKANILNSFLSSVFTKEDVENLLSLGDTAFPFIDSIQISTSLLKDLKLYKAGGPDGIPPSLLKETASNIAPMLSIIYEASLTEQTVPED